MKRSAKIAAAVAAGGALAVGGIATAAAYAAGPGPGQRPPTATRTAPPSGGQWGPGTCTGTGPQWQGGPGMGQGMGPGAGPGWRADRTPGTCLNAPTAQKGTLTAEQKSTLAAMAEEEKLSHDLYAAFAARYDAVVFDRITAAETRHLQAVRTLLGRYGVSDPTAGKAAGKFASQTVQATYDRLLAQGSASQQAALQVGKTVETDDIAALEKALSGLTAPDVRQVYTNLLAGSRHHLAAFTAWLGG